jgi:hypothetical protein
LTRLGPDALLAAWELGPATMITRHVIWSQQRGLISSPRVAAVSSPLEGAREVGRTDPARHFHVRKGTRRTQISSWLPGDVFSDIFRPGVDRSLALPRLRVRTCKRARARTRRGRKGDGDCDELLGSR